MSLIISLIIVIALTAFFGWLAVRAWRARRAIIKWPGVVVSGLLAVLGAFVAGVALFGLYRLNVPPGRPIPNLQVDPAPEQLARGERLAYLCVGCHSSSGKLPLDGGTENFAEALGTIYASNLTPGGSLKDWSEGQISRAIREGVDKNGRVLLIMPSESFRHLSDADVQALVAYLRTQPAVERQIPETQPSLLGAMLVGAGLFRAQPPLTASVVAPPAGPSPEYGQYLVTISGCARCHGDTLQGGNPDGFAPAGPNLLAIVSQWDADEFVETMQTGVDPYGNRIDPETMRWQDYSAAFDAEELEAMDAYIRSLTPSAEAAP
jgi:mono/diheme cytochrome c family protein